jgi:hypothetical protein
VDHFGVDPTVELLHEARLFLFGHGFVRFRASDDFFGGSSFRISRLNG